MRSPRLRAFLATVLATTVALLVGITLLPHDRYIRFQAAARESVYLLRLKWVYERIHFDPRPIDIAFIGTSHAQSGINAELVEKALADEGRGGHVVNFSIPWLGRDLHYEIVKELLENRKVGTLVVEVQDIEPRAPHPAFTQIADLGDILAAPAIFNVNYLDNFARLPLRQMKLFLDTWFPSLSGLSPRFDPQSYEAYWDDTYRPHGTSQIREGIHPAAYFQPKVDALDRSRLSKQDIERRLTFPGMRYSLTSRYNMIYLERLLELAKSKGSRIVFLYLPYFHGPEWPDKAAMFERYGPILAPREILADPGLWQNEDHLNVFGARLLSRWIAEQDGGRQLSPDGKV